MKSLFVLIFAFQFLPLDGVKQNPSHTLLKGKINLINNDSYLVVDISRGTYNNTL